MNKFSFAVVFTWMLAIVCVQSAVDHERRLLEFLEDRIPKHTLPSLQNDTGINLIAKHTSIDLKKQNWLRVRGGFRKGGGGRTLFLRRFDPLQTQRVSSLYYFEISSFGDRP